MGRVAAEQDRPLARAFRDPMVHAKPGGPDAVSNVRANGLRATHIEQRLNKGHRRLLRCIIRGGDDAIPVLRQRRHDDKSVG